MRWLGLILFLLAMPEISLQARFGAWTEVDHLPCDLPGGLRLVGYRNDRCCEVDVMREKETVLSFACRGQLRLWVEPGTTRILSWESGTTVKCHPLERGFTVWTCAGQSYQPKTLLFPEVNLLWRDPLGWWRVD